ncbi:hypothetical protein AMTRI_Chr12g268370 [Amborella trichopoda]
MQVVFIFLFFLKGTNASCTLCLSLYRLGAGECGSRALCICEFSLFQFLRQCIE